MLTYVINTSENKTFDSDKLFKLVEYNKICWMECSLDKISEYAEEIYDRQNTLEADEFRIAVIVDFYGFDKLRKPYGLNGYGEEAMSVDVSVYVQYVEAYIYDNLYANLENKEVNPKSFEVYYIQNSKYENFDLFENMEEQVKSILTPLESTEHPLTEEDKFKLKKQIAYNRKREKILKMSLKDRMAAIDNKTLDFDLSDDEINEVVLTDEQIEKNRNYETFNLYCTENLTLQFNLHDYPYTANTSMTFDEFIHSFYIRASIPTKIIRHHYVTEFGISPVSAAFDTLSLSFYLIKTYEREMRIEKELNFEIERIKKDVLKETLITSWRKIRTAMEIAKESKAMYYSLKEFDIADEEEMKMDNESIMMYAKSNVSRSELEKQYKTPEAQYARIKMYANHLGKELDPDDVTIIEEAMTEYLKKRDNTDKADINEDVKSEVQYVKTPTCPSSAEYEYVIEKQQTKISKMLDTAIKAERVQVDYKPEMERADAAYEKYSEAHSLLKTNAFIDGLVFLFIILISIIPYFVLQCFGKTNLSVGSVIIALLSICCFAGLYILTVFLKTAPILNRLNAAKSELLDNLVMCKAKQEIANQSLKKRYSSDLVDIEETRYKISELEKLQAYNVTINEQVRKHRELLEIIENSLSSMLNNLGVEPEEGKRESVEGEFDLNKSFKAPENRVYQIFSIETIEKMFPNKGE